VSATQFSKMHKHERTSARRIPVACLRHNHTSPLTEGEKSSTEDSRETPDKLDVINCVPTSTTRPLGNLKIVGRIIILAVADERITRLILPARHSACGGRLERPARRKNESTDIEWPNPAFRADCQRFGTLGDFHAPNLQRYLEKVALILPSRTRSAGIDRGPCRRGFDGENDIFSWPHSIVL